MANNKGTVIQVQGPVLDIRFADNQLPKLLNAIEIPAGDHTIVAEVAQHIGDNVVRCIAMSSTDGLQRGIDAVDTGAAISVPVGEKCLGRVFNLLGQPIDNKPAAEAAESWPIHRPAPSYEEQKWQRRYRLLQCLSADRRWRTWRCSGPRCHRCAGQPRQRWCDRRWESRWR